MTALAWAGIVGPTTLLLPRLALGWDPCRGIHTWSKRVLPALGVEVEVAGQLRLDMPLWVSNHLSWVDPIVLMSLRPMGTIAKADVSRYPIIGPLAKKAGLRFVERGDADSRAAALAAFASDLRSNRPMLLFPEGTTTHGEGLAPLHPGGLKAAWELGLPLQPLRLDSPAPHYPWTGDDTLLPHIRTLFATRTPVRVEARRPLWPGDFSSAEAWVDGAAEALSPSER